QLDQEDRVSENQISKFWHDALKPYGAQAKHWEHSEDPLDSVMSYLPANFKNKKNEAYRWKTQPWFVQTFRTKTGMWLVCLDGNPNKFESEAYQDLAALHSAMVKYLEKSDGIWPHPDQDAYESELNYSNFWIESLKPYGAEKKHWVHSSKPSAFGMDYMPSIFDGKKNTANRWEKQPWFIPRFKEQNGMWVVRRNGEPRIWKSGTVPAGQPDAKLQEND
ncbi:MAG: hypothetical protein QM496_11870, partial [Verrucomicrobiota bacterium]